MNAPFQPGWEGAAIKGLALKRGWYRFKQLNHLPGKALENKTLAKPL